MIIETVAASVSEHRLQPLVVDPVMISKSGAQLLRAGCDCYAES